MAERLIGMGDEARPVHDRATETTAARRPPGWGRPGALESERCSSVRQRAVSADTVSTGDAGDAGDAGKSGKTAEAADTANHDDTAETDDAGDAGVAARAIQLAVWASTRRNRGGLCGLGRLIGKRGKLDSPGDLARMQRRPGPGAVAAVSQPYRGLLGVLFAC
jgi:hypothetical protein